MRRRSWLILIRSASAYVTPVENCLDSASTVPFSAMMSCPVKTRSVEDSPSPASAYA